MSTDGKTLKFRAAKLKGFTVFFMFLTIHSYDDQKKQITKLRKQKLKVEILNDLKEY